MLQIKVKWSKAASAKTPDGDAIRRRLQQPMAYQTALAKILVTRAMKGVFATPAKPYKSAATAGPKKKKAYYISPQYAVELALGLQTKFASSAEMHQIAGIRAAGHASGAMWKGLQVRNFGSKGAVIEFGGSSLGSSSTRTAISRRVTGPVQKGQQAPRSIHQEDGSVKYRRKPKLVRNSEKAGRVFKNSRVGLLQPTQNEYNAIHAAFLFRAGQVVNEAFGLKAPGGQPTGDPALYREIMKEFNQ